MMNSMCVVASLIAWRGVLWHVSTERSVNLKSCDLILHISPRVFPLFPALFSVNHSPFPSLLFPLGALQGTGRYSVYVANYASGNIGPHALLEMDEAASDVSRGIIALSDVAAEARVNKLTGQEEISEERSEACDGLKLAYLQCAYCPGGRGVVVGPILSEARSDIFCDNENGPNFLFKNNGDGTFVDMARKAGEYGTGREEHESTNGRSRNTCN